MTVHVDGVVGSINNTNFGITPVTDSVGPTVIGSLYSVNVLWFQGIYGYITVYDAAFDAGQRASQRAVLQTIMAARGITLP